MVGPSIFFFLLFVIPLFGFLFWLVKQNKSKTHIWGLIIIALMVIIGFIVSQSASKNAVRNYKQHQADSREIEHENHLDSVKN